MKGFIIVLSLFALATFNDLPPQKPIIGIYTQDAEQFVSLTNQQSFQTYIAASYIKNIQMAGAIPIPLFYHYSQAQLEQILGKINGVFFPGGEMPIVRGNKWTDNTAFIIQYANKRNKQGLVYPIWATCLGYEAFMYLTSGNDDNTTVFTEVFGQDGKTCAQIVKNNDSKLLKSLNQEEYKEATTGNGLFFYHHRWAILLETYERNQNLKNFWNLISTSTTRDNVEFVATLEAKQYPYFATQYHPQKNAFQWRIPAKRSYNAISASQKYINTFMQFARQNTNKFPEDQLEKKIIFNYKPTLTPLEYSFLQVYIFDESAI